MRGQDSRSERSDSDPRFTQWITRLGPTEPPGSRSTVFRTAVATRGSASSEKTSRRPTAAVPETRICPILLQNVFPSPRKVNDREAIGERAFRVFAAETLRFASADAAVRRHCGESPTRRILPTRRVLPTRQRTASTAAEDPLRRIEQHRAESSGPGRRCATARSAAG